MHLINKIRRKKKKKRVKIKKIYVSYKYIKIDKPY